MKAIKSLLGTLLLLLVFMPTSGTAQDGHYYMATTWKLQVPEDGSNKQLKELLKEFSEKTVFKNEKIISEKVMYHISGADLRDVVVITEYANWNDIEAAKLMETGWPNEEERATFMKTFGKYVVTHSDEIFKEIPELAKK
ncbi:hypothetical protein [Zobellia galactanivorans]|uniref:Hypothetical periplasmic protein n=1 Tax=Zobellia galactanivorans (strain DSM 12802 / CCUG 47099 / CIP 106680 / NCIMB 13871 / Dsij) TaxID=63186 RepID=G0L8S1_ZOBGA|nr:hypothetical protein [Zobellia galactanivorans]CAZ97800.1 Hypothetical periplasmic protein [Zobellia galactanivorans]